MDDNLLDLENNFLEQDKQIFNVFLMAIFCSMSCAIYLYLLTIIGAYFMIPFLISVASGITGFVLLSKLKSKKYIYSIENKKRLIVTKILLWLSFIITITTFILALAFVIYLGINGFSR